MSNDSMRFVAKSLSKGNDALSNKEFDGFQLPEQSEVRDRIKAYFSDDKGTLQMPENLRKDINFILDTIYADSPSAFRPSSLSTGATEAIVVADGSRPVFFIEKDKLERKGIPNGPFVDAVDNAKTDLERIALSVGRIETDDLPPPGDLDTFYEGSAFLVEPDLVMTNRHVMERMVQNPYSNGPFTFKYDYWINFDGQLGGGHDRRFRIVEVLYGGDAYIGQGGDFSRLDMALLRLGEPALAGAAQPTKLVLSGSVPKMGNKVAVIGFPAPPHLYTGTGIPPANSELEDVLRKVFDMRFGYKRCAPGEISGEAGTIQNDPKQWIAKHNASTLGGNSGSPVISLATGKFSVSALHFFGLPRTANYAYVFEKLATTLQPFGVNVE